MLSNDEIKQIFLEYKNVADEFLARLRGIDEKYHIYAMISVIDTEVTLVSSLFREYHRSINIDMLSIQPPERQNIE